MHVLPWGESSAGNTRGLIEAQRARALHKRYQRSSAGNTRGLIEARENLKEELRWMESSAGNTRGLIEADGGSPRA